jgi:hypothetical protein
MESQSSHSEGHSCSAIAVLDTCLDPFFFLVKFASVPTQFSILRNSFIELIFGIRYPLKQCQIVPNSAISVKAYGSRASVGGY